MTLLIRPAKREDLRTLLEIEQHSFDSRRWKAADFIQNDCFIAEFDGTVAGFLVSRQIYAGDGEYPPEREILNLAVAPSFRRQGIATAMISAELRRAKEVFLEVRESNTGAQALYRKLGFVEVGRRVEYYDCPTETAIVMKMK